jgi:hypothetical protein
VTTAQVRDSLLHRRKSVDGLILLSLIHRTIALAAATYGPTKSWQRSR